MIGNVEADTIGKWLDHLAKQHLTGDVSIDANINMKLTHSFRVGEESEDIAKSLSLNQNDVSLAKICGLLHDVGRFRQYQVYRTFVDSKSEYHGKIGIDVLVSSGILEKFDSNCREIILKSVYNHGLLHIEENIAEPALLFCKIVRDADKIDIYRIVTDYYYQSNERNPALELGLNHQSNISTKALEAFESGNVVEKCDMESLNDFKILQLSWINDINFDYTIKTILKRNYLRMICESISDNKMRELTINILQNRLKDFEVYESL